MDSRVVGLILLGVGLVCLGTIGGVSAEAQFDQPDATQHSDGVTVESQTTNESGSTDDPAIEERPEPGSAVIGPFDEPGVYEVEVTDLSVVSIEVMGPGGGGGGYDTSDNGNAKPGGDGGYIHAKFDVSAFDKIKLTTGNGGSGGNSNGAGAGGDGFYSGGDGAQVVGWGGYHVASGGGGGATVIEGVLDDGTTVPLAAAGGGGGGASWDTTTPGGIKNTAGGGGGAAGGVGGTAEGSFGGSGNDGTDADSSSGPVSNDIGGDGGSAGTSSAEAGGDGGTWVNDQYVTNIEEANPGGGGSGGSAGGTGGEDGADGAVTLNPLIIVESLEYPESITPGENLTVQYTLTNTGDTVGTESFVDLAVDATPGFDDTNMNVTVAPGELVNGTLTFSQVDEYFVPGDTVEFSVELWDFNESASGETAVVEGSAPDLVVDDLAFPTVIEPTEDLNVGYTIENVGDEAGTESAVELTVDGALADTDENVTVGAGETANGTLTFDDVEGNYGDGDTISFAVSLAEFGDSKSGETGVQEIDGSALVLAEVDAPDSMPPAGTLDVQYTIENVGEEAGTESAVDLVVDGTAVDTDTNVSVGAGETATGTLTYSGAEGAYAPGETVQFTVALADSNDSQSDETYLLTDGEINLVIEPSSPVVDPGAVQTYEVVVEGADSGILGYQGVVIDIADPAVGNITSFEEQFDGSGAFSNSEIRNGGERLYLEAAAGESFVDPGPTATIATFDVEAVGSEGSLTDLTFDGSAAQTVAEFETGTPYDINEERGASLILDAGEGPNLVLTDVQAPDTIGGDEDLTVNYTVENFGGEEGTESALTLSVDGDQADQVTNLTVGPDESASGTLTFDGVDQYDPGDTIDWTVALQEFGGSQSGQTQIPTTGEPDLVLGSLEYPDSIGLDEDLTVEYTVENVGDAEGTESAVELLVAGLAAVDTDEDVTVGPGESASGTLVFPGVDQFVGEVIEFTVALQDFEDTENGSASVEEASEAEFQVESIETNAPLVEGTDLELTVTVANVGGAAGTQSVTAQAGDLGQASAEFDLDAGSSGQKTLVLGTEVGDTGEHTVTVETDDHSMSESVELHLPPLPNHDSPPQNVDSDTLYEDVNGDGMVDIFDVQTFFNNFQHTNMSGHAWAYDFDGDGDITIIDVQMLFEEEL